MSLEKIKVASPDLILKRADQSEGALAKIAHVNEIVRQLNASSASIELIGTATPLSATTVSGLKDEVELRLKTIEEKVDALIKALA